jgi:hypothetical protein
MVTQHVIPVANKALYDVHNGIENPISNTQDRTGSPGQTDSLSPPPSSGTDEIWSY